MRSYAQQSPTFWTRGAGKRLRGKSEAVHLVHYLSTSPSSNMIGLYYLPLPMICHDTGIGEAVVRALLADPVVAEYVQYDFEAELVWLPEHALEQLGEVLKATDKRRPGVARELGAVGAHPFATAFRARYGAGFGLDLKPLPPGDDAPRKGLPATQEPPDPSPSPSRVQSCDPSASGDLRGWARDLLAEPDLARGIDPTERIEVRRALKAYEKATGARRAVGSVSDDTGLETLLGLFAAGLSDDDVCRGYDAVIRSEWWRRDGARRGLSSITLEVISRELTEIEQREAQARSRARQREAGPRKTAAEPLGTLLTAADILKLANEQVSRG